MCNCNCHDITLSTNTQGPAGPAGADGSSGASIIYNNTTAVSTAGTAGYETLMQYTVDTSSTGTPLSAVGDMIEAEIIFRQVGFTNLGSNGTQISLQGSVLFTHRDLTFTTSGGIMRKFILKITRKSATSLFIELVESTYGHSSSAAWFGGNTKVLSSKGDHHFYIPAKTVTNIDSNDLLIEAEAISEDAAGNMKCEQLLVKSYKKI